MQVQGLADSYGNAAQGIQRVNREFQRRRSAYWGSFPHAADSSMQHDFDDVLAQRDFWYVAYSLPTGPYTPATMLFDFTGNKLDGGIPKFAKPEFDRWVCLMRETEGVKRHGSPFNGYRNSLRRGELLMVKPQMLSRMFDNTEVQRLRYQIRRDWAEYQAAGHDKDFYSSPDDFLRFWMWHAWDRRWADEPKTVEDVKAGQQLIAESVQVMERLYGRDTLYEVTRQVMDLKRDEFGRISGGGELEVHHMMPHEAVHELMRRRSPRDALIAGHLFDHPDHRRTEINIRHAAYLWGRDILEQVGRELHTAKRDKGQSYWKVKQGTYRYFTARPGGHSQSIGAAFAYYLNSHDVRADLSEEIIAARKLARSNYRDDSLQTNVDRLIDEAIKREGVDLPFDLGPLQNRFEPTDTAATATRVADSDVESPTASIRTNSVVESESPHPGFGWTILESLAAITFFSVAAWLTAVRISGREKVSQIRTATVCASRRAWLRLRTHVPVFVNTAKSVWRLRVKPHVMTFLRMAVRLSTRAVTGAWAALLPMVVQLKNRLLSNQPHEFGGGGTPNQD